MILAAATGLLSGTGPSCGSSLNPLQASAHVARGRRLDGGDGNGRGYVSSVLRDMYGDSLPKAAQQLLKDHAKIRSASAPPPGKAWATTGLVQQQAPSQRRRVDLKVPRVGRGTAASTSDGQLPLRPPKLPKRKNQAEILRETNNYEREELPVAPVRDGAEEKRRLQDLRAFGSVATETRRVKFSSSLPPSREGREASGLTSEQDTMAAEIVRSVRERQQELDGVEEALQTLVSSVEAQPATVGAGRDKGGADGQRTQLHKRMAVVSKQRLELKAAIRRDVQDLEKLMDLAPE